MPGAKTFILSLAACSALWAQTEYLPLQTGNTWIYRSNAGSFTVEVGKPETFGGASYFAVRGFPSTPAVWLRNTDEGRILMWDAQTKTEKIWLDTATAVPGESPTGVDPCNEFSRVESREAKYSGPIGEFTNALSVRYSYGSCADAGLDGDVLQPWVGIVQRTAQTIAGPRKYDLVYARIGGVTVLTAPEVSFTVAASQAQTALDVRLSLRNTTAAPTELNFNSGQQFDVVLYDENGKEVYQWSRGKAFTQVVGHVTVSGEKSWLVEAPLTDIPAGRYALKGWLTTSDGPNYSGTVAITIQ